MSKIISSSILLILLILFLGCGGSKTESESKTADSALKASETGAGGILDSLNKENIDEYYDQLVLGQAPDFILFNLDGTRYTLEDFKDYVIILHFWSMESALSKRLFPLLSEVNNMFRDSNFVILGVCMDTREIKSIREYADYNKISFPIVYPQSQTIYRSYGVAEAGVSYLIDRKGNVVGQFFGDPGREKLIRIISLFL